MANWTQEALSRVYDIEDDSQLVEMHQKIRQSLWREEYHVQTVTGLMNDPNGFCFYDGRWHLFYQWFPYGGVHGMKHWYHVESEDLVRWSNLGLALKPDLLWDNHGCYSGSAFVEDDKMYIVYTGNNNDIQGRRHPYQLLATMDASGRITKAPKPIITENPNYTEHQRDPKLFKHDGIYYILLGAQRRNRTGTMLLYRSDKIDTGWTLLGEMIIKDHDDLGYMVECPDIEKIGDQWVLLFSPQGLLPQRDKFRNKYNNVYFIGDFDPAKCIFRPKNDMTELDLGFDFYAAQCAYHPDLKDTAIMEAWMGVSDYVYPPTEDEGWAGLQTLPRELTIRDGKLYQNPTRNVNRLKDEVIFEAKNGRILHDSMHGVMPRASIFEVNLENGYVQLNLFSTPGRKGFEIKYDRIKKILEIDKEDMVNVVNPEYDTNRKVFLKNGLKTMKIFVDHSSVEIFINDGEYVMSSRVFPEEPEHLIRMGGTDLDLTVYSIRRGVYDNYKI